MVSSGDQLHSAAGDDKVVSIGEIVARQINSVEVDCAFGDIVRDKVLGRLRADKVPGGKKAPFVGPTAAVNTFAIGRAGFLILDSVINLLDIFDLNIKLAGSERVGEDDRRSGGFDLFGQNRLGGKNK